MDFITHFEHTVKTKQQARLAITHRNQRASPLLRLPGDIRNIIYDFVLTDGTLWDCRDTNYGFEKFYGCWNPGCKITRARRRILDEQSGRLTILSVCRQLQAETSVLPFKLNAFVFNSSRMWRFLVSPGARKFDFIRTVVIELHLHTGWSWADSPELWIGSEPLEQIDLNLDVVLPGLRTLVVDVKPRRWERFHEVMWAVDRLEELLKDMLVAGNRTGVTFQIQWYPQRLPRGRVFEDS